MPELPEVETIRRQLEPLVVGRKVVEAWAFPHPKFEPGLEAAGAVVEGVSRRGKYLLLALDDGRDLVIHLGMTGSLRVRPPGDPGDAYVRATWTLDPVTPLLAPSAPAPGRSGHGSAAGRSVGAGDVPAADRRTVGAGDVPAADRRSVGAGEVSAADRWSVGAGEVLEYRDVRRFGRLAVAESGSYAGTLGVQGPDALDPALTADDLWRALRRSRRAVKTQLLSQRPLAGVGNIYADEALWRSMIHPARRTVTRRQAAVLLDAVRAVLTEAIEHRGTTLRDYRTVDGEPGANQFRLDCYGRAGLPCHRCGTELRHTVLDARSTTWCPRCQKR